MEGDLLKGAKPHNTLFLLHEYNPVYVVLVQKTTECAIHSMLDKACFKTLPHSLYLY